MSKSSIENLERLGFATLEIADRFTSFVLLFEKMKESLKKTCGRYIDIYASEKEEENLCDDMVPAARIMKRIVNSICGRDNIINLCMQMHIQDSDLIFEHSIMTSVFSGLLAGSLHLSDTEIENTIVGGLLHNIGVLEMAYLIPEKDQLYGQEALLWREHPQYGCYAAIQEGISREIANIILMHHEKWDGSGYPNKLKGDEILTEAQIVSVCSSISDFLFFRKQPPYEAM